jgi:hypothetical protein
MKSKKGQVAGIVALVVGLIVAVILLVAVLVPVTTDVVETAGNSNEFLGASGAACNNTVANWSGCASAFAGVNKTVTDNFTTFILIGVLVLIAGIAIYGMAKRG